MLKQSTVQDAIADYNSTLPHHLPQWSRVNTLDKGRYPKAFLKDRLQPLPNLSSGGGGLGGAGGGGMDGGKDSQDSDDRELSLSDKMNPEIRVQHLEKSLHFLRTQHQEVLANLHEEIDTLKRQNKELNFRIVMLQKSGGSSLATSAKRSSAKRSANARQPANTDKSNRDLSAASLRGGHSEPLPPVEAEPEHQADERVDEIKLIFLEEEIKELKKAVREEKNKNAYLSQVLDKTEREKQTKLAKPPLEPLSLPEDTPRSSEVSDSGRGLDESELERSDAALTVARLKEAERQEQEEQDHPSGPLPFNASINPLQVHLPAQAARPPNMKECEIIVRHLQQLSDKQSHELSALKSDLRDVLYSHKWTPDAYLLAKAYIADDDARESQDGNGGKIAMRQTSRKLPDIAYVQKDSVSLPALRQTVSNKAVERRKRTQILQKARLRREIGTIQQ